MAFYTTTLGWQSSTAISLCNDPKNIYNFADVYQTCLALTTCYVYGSNFNVANANYFYYFSQLTGINMATLA